VSREPALLTSVGRMPERSQHRVSEGRMPERTSGDGSRVAPNRRMLDELGSFPRVGTELPSEAEGKDPREETSAVAASGRVDPSSGPGAGARTPLPNVR